MSINSNPGQKPSEAADNADNNEPQDHADQDTKQNGESQGGDMPDTGAAEEVQAGTGAQAEMAVLQEQLAQARDQMLRAMADAENTRKRAIKERDDAGRYAISGFGRDLLEVADNLRRALDAVPDDLKDADVRVQNLFEGIEATERVLLKTFEKHGIKKLEPMGEVFDPNFHEVMFETPGTGQPPGTIVQVLETGYLLKDRLLRPARVGVAKAESADHSGGNAHSNPANGPGGQIDTEA